jgi:hypothetical protein
MTQSWTDERKGLAYEVTKGTLGSPANNHHDMMLDVKNTMENTNTDNIEPKTTDDNELQSN